MWLKYKCEITKKSLNWTKFMCKGPDKFSKSGRIGTQVQEIEKNYKDHFLIYRELLTGKSVTLKLLSFPIVLFIIRLEKDQLAFLPLHFLLGRRGAISSFPISQWTDGLLQRGGRKHKLPLVFSTKEYLRAKAIEV